MLRLLVLLGLAVATYLVLSLLDREARADDAVNPVNPVTSVTNLADDAEKAISQPKPLVAEPTGPKSTRIPAKPAVSKLIKPKASAAKASAAKASAAKALGAKALGAKALGAKALGAKAAKPKLTVAKSTASNVINPKSAVRTSTELKSPSAKVKPTGSGLTTPNARSQAIRRPTGKAPTLTRVATGRAGDTAKRGPARTTTLGRSTSELGHDSGRAALTSTRTAIIEQKPPLRSAHEIAELSALSRAGLRIPPRAGLSALLRSSALPQLAGLPQASPLSWPQLAGLPQASPLSWPGLPGRPPAQWPQLPGWPQAQFPSWPQMPGLSQGRFPSWPQLPGLSPAHRLVQLPAPPPAQAARTQAATPAATRAATRAALGQPAASLTTADALVPVVQAYSFPQSSASADLAKPPAAQARPGGTAPRPAPARQPADRSSSTGQARDSGGGSAPTMGTVSSSWRPEVTAAGRNVAVDLIARGRTVRYAGPPS